MSPIDRVGTWLAGAIGFALGVVLAAMVVIVTYQVFSRFHTSIPFWGGTEEIARGLFVWLVMLGAALAVRSREHFFVDILPAATPAPVQRVLRVVVLLTVLVVSVVLVVYGWEFAVSGLKRRSLVTHLPAIWSYSAIVTGAVLMTLFALRDLLRLRAGDRNDGDPADG
ncbi:TRAP transporter small permease [Microbaculum marinum]|uniref:TRAP transporter small permease protein n=1 Tax=Microbaculum marinum TaxID=1764581 RepID=A0AAW9RZ15_9HYPH